MCLSQLVVGFITKYGFQAPWLTPNMGTQKLCAHFKVPFLKVLQPFLSQHNIVPIKGIRHMACFGIHQSTGLNSRILLPTLWQAPIIATLSKLSTSVYANRISKTQTRANSIANTFLEIP